MNLTSVSLSKCFLLILLWHPLRPIFLEGDSSYLLSEGRPLSGIQELTAPAQKTPGVPNGPHTGGGQAPSLRPAQGSSSPQRGVCFWPKANSRHTREAGAVLPFSLVSRILQSSALGVRNILGDLMCLLRMFWWAPSKQSDEHRASFSEELSKVIPLALRKKRDSFFICLQPWGVSEKS